MIIGSLTPTPYQTVFDVNGDPVSGALITTNLAGTSTPAATYTDADLAVANANPIVADSAGRYVAFLEPNIGYKFLFADSGGVPIPGRASQDNIFSVGTGNIDVPGVAGMALTVNDVVYCSSGAGGETAGRWYQTDADFGAKSTDPIMIGVVLKTALVGAAINVRIGGRITGLGGLAAGATYYASTVAGAITITPTTNARVIGVADSATTLLISNFRRDWTVVTTTAVGVQDNFAPGIIGNTILRCNNATLLTIDGFAAGYDGQRISVLSIGAGQVNLMSQAAGSTAANRLLNFVQSGATPLAAGIGTAEFVYDATTARWRLTEHEQGTWISPAFVAGEYTASAGAWGVDLADVVTNAFYLKGRSLMWSLDIVQTDLSGAATGLRFTPSNPYNYVPTKRLIVPAIISDAGTNLAGYMDVNPAVAYFVFSQLNGGALTITAADNTAVEAQISYEVN